MAALLAERYDTSAQTGGWQEMRQQLFGQQRQRDAEIRLLRVLGEIHARLNGVTRSNPSSVVASPRVRAKALTAIVAGANQLICWHRDELLANRTAGRWTSPLPDTAQQILAEVQVISSLFDGAHVTGRTIECGDVADSIAALVGPESESFFNDALAGASAMLRFAFDRIAADPPTAPAADGLGDTWDTLLADVDALTIPPRAMPVEPDPAPLAEAREVRDTSQADAVGARILALFPVRDPEPSADPDAPVIASASSVTSTAPPVISEAAAVIPTAPHTSPTAPAVTATASPVILSAPLVILSAAKDLLPDPPSEHAVGTFATNFPIPTAPPLAGIVPFFEARFTRIQLEAC